MLEYVPTFLPTKKMRCSMHGLEIDQRFERYRVLRALGSGVSGISYEAEDLMLHHKVTLKLIHPWSTLADSARRQFFRDMQSISLLIHPFHAAMHDYGEVEGQLYIARRFVSTGSLLSQEGRSLYSPPFSIADTILYAHQLAQVLHNIHRFGYIHGSLTLSNILVLREPNFAGEPDFAPFLLSDIGLAYFVRRFGQPRSTRLPITAAPEQWKGRHLPASDQYALAVLVYLWLTGRPPFIGSPEEIEQAKHKASFPLLSLFNPQITLEQEGIMRRALNASPDARYPTILAFIEAMQSSLARQPKLPEQPQPSVPVATEPLAYPAKESMSLAELELNDALSLEENDIIAAAPNATNHDVEPISSTFLLDQNAIRLLTAMAKGEKSPSEPSPEIEPASPLPRPGETPLPPVEPEPETERTQPEPPDPAEPVMPEVLPPAPDTAQPQPEPTLPDVEQELATPQPETTPAPSPDAQKKAEDAQAPVKLITALTITSPYLAAPQEFHLEKEEITLGHAGSSDILLDQDQTTSRHHAMLQRKDNQYYVYDLLSDHGVLVNGNKLTPGIGVPLVDGDCIYICSYTLTLHLIPMQSDHEQTKEPAIS